jgi:hypothetical protein
LLQWPSTGNHSFYQPLQCVNTPWRMMTSKVVVHSMGSHDSRQQTEQCTSHIPEEISVNVLAAG